jgi:Holliday junction resolvase RusA-like endonuclease
MTQAASIAFDIPGAPIGKGRPRVGRVNGHARLHTPEKTAAYEGLVALAGRQAMAGRGLITGPVAVVLDIRLVVAESWSKKRQTAALVGEILPTKKPDIDNVEKAIFDGLNGVVWKDDVQVVDVVKRKRFAATPGVSVEIELLSGEGS